MGLETADFISQLEDDNPTDTDFVSQGDDHIRLIKKVLQSSFPVALQKPLIPNTVGNENKVLTINSDATEIVWEDPHIPKAGENFFTYWKSSNQTEASNQWTKVIFDIQKDDASGVWSNSTFTAPADGLYYFEFWSRITEASIPDHDIGLFNNSVIKKQLAYTDYQSGDNKYHSIQMSAVLRGSEGEEFSFKMKSETRLTLLGSGNALSGVSGYRIS